MTAPKYRIMWIEDDRELLQLSTFILQHKGFDVIPVLDSREALDTIRREKPDLILLDLMMPEMDGWAVYREVKAAPDLKHIPVIVVTAKAHSADKAMALHLAKVDGYLAKPYEQAQLLAAIDEVLQRRRSGGEGRS